MTPPRIVDEVKVLGTWLGGKKIDIVAYVAAVQAADPTEHQDLSAQVATKKCC